MILQPQPPMARDTSPVPAAFLLRGAPVSSTAVPPRAPDLPAKLVTVAARSGARNNVRAQQTTRRMPRGYADCARDARDLTDPHAFRATSWRSARKQPTGRTLRNRRCAAARDRFVDDRTEPFLEALDAESPCRCHTSRRVHGGRIEARRRRPRARADRRRRRRTSRSRPPARSRARRRSAARSPAGPRRATRPRRSRTPPRRSRSAPARCAAGPPPRRRTAGPVSRTVGPASRRSRRYSGPSPTTTSGSRSALKARIATSIRLCAISSASTR